MSRSIPATEPRSAAALAQVAADRPLLEVKHPRLLLMAVMMVSLCQFFDATIANVALPFMRVGLNASPDSISWVLTSFIMAGAIFTPMTGWLSDRIGSRRLFMSSTIGFLVASALCGMATSLPAMVAFRTLQGIAAAFIGPMTQTIMFDINPPSKQAQTMSQFSMLVMVAPISGPFLGGFLTDYLNWRWIFYVNLPLGVPALVMLWWLLPSRPMDGRRLDMTGLVWIGLGLGALQLMLDRGQQKDWFDSWEVIIEGIVALSCLWIFLIHTRITRTPLFARKLFANPNFVVALGMMFVLGVTNVALSAALPTMYQAVYNYPVMDSGLLMAPRGMGVIITTLLATRFLTRGGDFRFMIMGGFLIAAYSLWMMTGWSLEMGPWLILVSSFVQGLGLGMVFSPMSVVAFGTVDPVLRPDGSSLMALFRNLGGSFGISLIVTMVARNQQISHEDIASNVTAGFLPGLNLPAGVDRLPSVGSTVFGMIDAEVTRQSAMVAYLDNFYAMFWLLLVMAPLPFLLKRPRKAVEIEPLHMD